MPDVFLSYAADDAHVAEKLAKLLEEDGINVWLDKAAIKPGDNWVAAITNAIQNTTTFIPIISSASSRSHYISSEIATAIAAKSQDPRRKIIPVLIDRDSTIPSFIDQYQYLDLSKGINFTEGASKLSSIIINEGDARNSNILIQSIKAGSDIQIQDIVNQTITFELQQKQKHLYIRRVYFVSLFATMLGALMASFVVLFYDPEKGGSVTQILLTISPFLTGLFGTAVGFYFGSSFTNTKERPHSEAPK